LIWAGIWLPRWASIRIENTGDGVVRWAGGGCGEAGGIVIDALAAVPQGKLDWPGRLGSFKRQALGLDGAVGGAPMNVGYVPESRIGKNIVCTADLRIERLGPGETLAYRAGWDGQLGNGPAPAGPATVSATFPFIGIEGEVDPSAFDPAILIEASIKTTIVGAGVPSAMPLALAVDAALADEQFAAWVDVAPEDTWINPNIVFQDGLWSVGLFRMGNAVQMEMYGEVKVDANGAIVGRRFEP